MLANSLNFFDAFVGTTEELKKKCVDVFERLAKHTESSVKGTESRDLCWVMLARLLFRCDEEILRTLGSRVSKRLVDVTRQPMSKAIVVFMRAAVDRIPSLMAQNRKTLRAVCLTALDYGVLTAHSESNSDTLELAVDTFAACFGFSEAGRVLNTLKELMDGAVISESTSEHLIFIEQIKFSNRRNLLIRTMLLLYRRSLQKAKKEKTLDLGVFLNLAERALLIDDAEITSAVLISIRTLVHRCRWSLLLHGSTIVSLLMDRVASSEIACIVLTEISDVFGISSTVAKHPEFLTLTKIGSWIESDHALQISQLMISVLTSSSFAMKRHTILEMQHNLCSLLLIRGPSMPLLKLLNAFLLLNHEQIPSPIQIARTLSTRWCPSKLESSVAQEIRLCRSICDATSHPRMQLLVNVKDAVAQIAIDAENERKNEELEAILEQQKKMEIPVEEEKVQTASIGSQTEIEQKLEEIPVKQPKRVPEPTPSEEVEESQPMKKAKIEEEVAEPPKEVEEIEVVVKAKKPKVVKKKEVPEPKLAEGELSVEDMLLDFCPQ
ncbi:hypothetical protein L596_008166 [Steinernema carpocapsae]|uniref:Pre-rRNA-processing protein RIX1 N-terminal domain-containing protein n=1 Tax=Steinernema carpocapsae TaxID=34508 RepID=A0A4V6XWK8_STECR|nr:hypothetical protein L596_008166 [Steinernema carpocapsae]